MYNVVVGGRILFAHKVASVAFAWRDGYGCGRVCEVLSEAQEKPAPRRSREKRLDRKKTQKTGAAR